MIYNLPLCLETFSDRIATRDGTRTLYRNSKRERQRPNPERVLERRATEPRSKSNVILPSVQRETDGIIQFAFATDRSLQQIRCESFDRLKSVFETTRSASFGHVLGYVCSYVVPSGRLSRTSEYNSVRIVDIAFRNCNVLSEVREIISTETRRSTTLKVTAISICFDERNKSRITHGSN